MDGHDVVSVPYPFSSTLLTDFASPGVSEPQLAKVGGTWDEPFILPIDPELLFQRTGFACMDEESVPVQQRRQRGGGLVLRPDRRGREGAVERRQLPLHAPADRVVRGGAPEPRRQGRDVPALPSAWHGTRRSRVSSGSAHVTGNEPDLQIYVPDFLPSRTNYRYVHATGSGGCEVEEGSVGGTGWRRLLQFATSDENVGNRALTIGGVDYTLSGHAGELDLHNLFELSPCHQHYHFKYYGDLGWAGNGTIANSKLGFCLQSTNRVANREGSPLHNQFAGCDFQGVEAGWVDQYKAGLPNQWLDTTDLKKGVGTRSFQLQPERVPLRGDVRRRERRPARPQRSGGMGTDRADRRERRAGGGSAVPEDPDLGRQQLRHHAGDDRGARTRPHHERLHARPDRAAAQLRLRNEPEDRRLRTGSAHDGDVLDQGRRTAAGRPAHGVQPRARHLRSRRAIEDSWVPLQPGVSDQPAMLANAVVSSSTTVTFTCPSPRTAGVRRAGRHVLDLHRARVPGRSGLQS